jgi:hypothetical protein
LTVDPILGENLVYRKVFESRCQLAFVGELLSNETQELFQRFWGIAVSKVVKLHHSGGDAMS